MQEDANMSDNIIELRDLVVKFPLYIGTIYAVNKVNLDIPRGAITALVGESGSGKSTIASAMLSMVSNPSLIARTISSAKNLIASSAAV